MATSTTRYAIQAMAVFPAALLALATASPAQAQPGWVLSHQKISETQGGFTGNLDLLDEFGWSVASLGDLDGDGVADLAVAAPGDDDGSPNRGAVWVLFLDGVAACPWDLNGDGIVDVDDLLEVVHNFGPCDDPRNCPADFNGDGIVGVADLVALVHNFGPCP